MHRRQQIPQEGTSMSKKRRRTIIFRTALGAVICVLALLTLQILFDVPVFSFIRTTTEALDCCPPDSPLRAALIAEYDGGVQKASGDVTDDVCPSLIVQRGIPVQFTLNSIQSAGDASDEYVSFPDFGIREARIGNGENIVCFTPEESGVFEYYFRTGDLASTVTVVESLGFPPSSPSASLSASPPPSASASQSSSASALPVPSTSQPSSSNANTHAVISSDFPEDTPANVLPDEMEYSQSSSNDSLSDWFQKQLMPASGIEGVHEIRTWTGWVFDRDCIGIDPAKHTKACNLMGKCFESGLGIFEYIPGKELNSYTAEDTYLVFDGASKELAAAFLGTLPEDWKNNVTVNVSGYIVGNIPASADELLIPETDSRLVDHYLTGIHITSIKPAYIEGVSTNQMPEHDIEFTQP